MDLLNQRLLLSLLNLIRKPLKIIDKKPPNSYIRPIVINIMNEKHNPINFQSSLEMDDFPKPAVDCFVEAMYTGKVDLLEKDIFEDVNKMAHVFEVCWLTKTCLKFFETDVLNFQKNSYNEIVFACEIASRAQYRLKQNKYVSLFVKNMTLRGIVKKLFLRRYMSDFPALSKRQLNMTIQIARKDLDILMDCLTNYISFVLKYKELDENSLYLLENVDLKEFQRRYPDKFVEVADLVAEIAEGSENDEVRKVLEKLASLRDGAVGEVHEVTEDSESSDSSDNEDGTDVAVQTE